MPWKVIKKLRAFVGWEATEFLNFRAPSDEMISIKTKLFFLISLLFYNISPEKQQLSKRVCVKYFSASNNSCFSFYTWNKAQLWSIRLEKCCKLKVQLEVVLGDMELLNSVLVALFDILSQGTWIWLWLDAWSVNEEFDTFGYLEKE